MILCCSVLLLWTRTHGRIMKPWVRTCNKIHRFQPQIRDTFKPPQILTNTKSKNNWHQAKLITAHGPLGLVGPFGNPSLHAHSIVFLSVDGLLLWHHTDIILVSWDREQLWQLVTHISSKPLLNYAFPRNLENNDYVFSLSHTVINMFKWTMFKFYELC